jgi:predicted tellurium resistance membrane protein TerC
MHTWPTPRPTHGHAAAPRLPHRAQHVALMLGIVAALVLSLIYLLA